MRVVTTEPPNAPPTRDSQAHPRRLRRRQTDRVIAGVAGGGADYLNVDPLLLRAGFAGLMVFGGAGSVLYVVAWLLIPSDGRDGSIAEGLLTRLGLRFGRAGVAVLVFLAVVAGGAWLTGYGPGQRFRDVVLFAAAIVALGIVLLRWGEGPRGSRLAETNGSTAANAEQEPGPHAEPAVGAATVRAMASTAAARSAARPPDRSPLAWYVTAATLVAVGLLAVVSNLPGLHVTLGQYLGAVLAVFGLGLVVGVWWGRARILIVLGFLLLPIAGASAFVNEPLAGGIGDLAFRPETPAELRSEYRLAAGDLRLDLTGLAATDQPVSLSASVGVGRLIVVVPADARLQLDASVNGGRLSLLGTQQIGTWLADRVERSGDGSLHLILRLETGLGGLSVEVAPAR